MRPSLVREPWWTATLRDALRVAFGGAIAAAVLAAVLLPPLIQPRWLDVLGRLLAGVLAELVAILLLRSMVPTARVGAHRVGWNRPYLRWIASATLNEVVMGSLFRAPFFAFEQTRVLYLQALGARVAWSARLPASLTVRDPSLWVVHSGAQVESGVTIETALHGAGVCASAA